MEAFEYMRQSIRERGWSIPEFARQANVSLGLAYKWLAEDPVYRITPSPKSCEKIATALGVDLDLMLELAGHRRRPNGEPHAQIDARRQAVRDQLDRWLSAVGPDNEEYFWSYLKAQGDSTVDLIRRVGTAVNASGDTAVNAAVSERKRRGRKPRGDSDSRLTQRQHPSSGHFIERRPTPDRRRAA